MTYRNRYRTGKRHLMIGDALAYGRSDMDLVLKEILEIEAIHIPCPLNH
ncbi:MAG: hypothetical protein AB8B83_06045 [Bdellovibrionales bacterium]